MASGSTKAIIGAVVANSFLAIVKLIAFVHSGSGAMLSEAIHSIADASNQFLLYVGIRRSRRPADRRFHYGYGGERFLFALASAAGIFVLGCGVTIYHGIRTLIDPRPLSLSWLTFAVLALSFVVEGSVLTMAARAIWKAKENRSLFEYLRTSTDLSAAAVLLEDAVACLGILVAATGILLSAYTGSPVYDAIGSIVIGILLGGVAAWLTVKNRALILGQAIPQDVQDEAVEMLEAEPSVAKVGTVKSLVLGAQRFRFAAGIDFNGRYFGKRFAAWVRSRLPEIETQEQMDEFSEEFGERVLDALGEEVDRLEAELVEEFPRLRHIDLEAD